MCPELNNLYYCYRLAAHIIYTYYFGEGAGQYRENGPNKIEFNTKITVIIYFELKRDIV